MFLYSFVVQGFCRSIYIFLRFWKAVRDSESSGKKTATGLLIFTKYVMKFSQNKVERVSNINYYLTY